MEFYPSKNHDILNGAPFHPDLITGTAMVNPHYPHVSLAAGVRAISDGGSFQKRDMLDRKTPAAALDRQLALEDHLGPNLDPERNRKLLRLRKARPTVLGREFKFEAIITYDQLLGVDEAINSDGERVKRRGTEKTGAAAIEETIRSAEYYASQRHRIAGAIAFAAQGVTVGQYLACTRALLDVMRPGDWFAFGGFCIVGQQRSLLPQFIETVGEVLPLLRHRGIHRAHILGVCYHPALIAAAELGRRHGINFSTDSSSIERNSVHGKVWTAERMATGRSPMRQVFAKEHKKAEGPISYHPCELAIENIVRFSRWSASLVSVEEPSPFFNTPVPVQESKPKRSRRAPKPSPVTMPKPGQMELFHGHNS